MAFTYSISTDRGRVRLLCTDTVSAAAFFNDDEIDAFLALESANVKRAAALALETMAASEVLVQKRIRLLDLQTDGPAEAKALMDRAALLRKQATTDDADEDGGTFDVAELAVTDFSTREIISRGLHTA